MQKEKFNQYIYLNEIEDMKKELVDNQNKILTLEKIYGESQIEITNLHESIEVKHS